MHQGCQYYTLYDYVRCAPFPAQTSAASSHSRIVPASATPFLAKDFYAFIAAGFPFYWSKLGFFNARATPKLAEFDRLGVRSFFVDT